MHTRVLYARTHTLAHAHTHLRTHKHTHKHTHTHTLATYRVQLNMNFRLNIGYIQLPPVDVTLTVFNNRAGSSLLTLCRRLACLLWLKMFFCPGTTPTGVLEGVYPLHRAFVCSCTVDSCHVLSYGAMLLLCCMAHAHTHTHTHTQTHTHTHKHTHTHTTHTLLRVCICAST